MPQILRKIEMGKIWLRGLDLNQRPSGYEPDELPGCSTPRQLWCLLYEGIPWKIQGEK